VPVGIVRVSPGSGVTPPVINSVARFPRRVLTRQATRLRARLQRRRLDAALAAGADPWSAAELMLRASRLSSLGERQEIAAALDALVTLAEQDRPVSHTVHLRCGVVLEQRDTLLELAARLREPAPVSVAVVATLAWLAQDASSPAYVGGSPPAGMADTAARCDYALRSDSERL
jgi:hypothetical protein